MTDKTRPEPLAEQTADPGQGPLPDLPDSAYRDDAVDLPEADVPATDDGDTDPDATAGDFTDPDVDLTDVLPGWDVDPETEDDES